MKWKFYNIIDSLMIKTNVKRSVHVIRYIFVVLNFKRLFYSLWVECCFVASSDTERKSQSLK